MTNPNDLNTARQYTGIPQHGGVTAGTPLPIMDYARTTALQLAIQMGATMNAEGIVEDAKTFHKFLTGTQS